MYRLGERHDGEGRYVRAIRHIRGAGIAPGILAQDSARADGVLFYVQQGFADVAILSAAVKTLRATPVVLVAAPGVGYFLEFVSAFLMLDYAGTNVFSEAAAYDTVVRYGITTGVIASQTIESTGWLYQAADTYTNALPKIDAIGVTAGLENLALVLHNSGAGEVAGNAGADNIVRVRTFFRIHQLLV